MTLRLLQTIPSALAALRANKGRSVLTTLGIIIGVAAVIAIVALGQGASASVSSQLGLGTNLLTIMPGQHPQRRRRGGAGTGTTLKAADADAIARQVRASSGVQPGRVRQRPDHRRQPELVRPAFRRVAPDYLPINDWKIAQGSFFTDQDNTDSQQRRRARPDRGHATCSPIGEAPIGQLIRIRNVPFTVDRRAGDQGQQRLRRTRTTRS